MASTGANVDINYSLIQGFACGLQCNNASVHIDSSIFREFPLRKQGRNGNPVDNLEYKDSDHDAMYIVGGNVSISRSAVGFAMDDCIDSGTGPGGYIKISESYVQSCYHEGIALSDNGFDVPKTVYIEQVIVEDCQQGIGVRFQYPFTHGFVEDVIFSSNYVGLRIGDNYGWQVDGMLVCNRCLFHDNVIGILDLHAKQFGPLKTISLLEILATTK